VLEVCEEVSSWLGSTLLSVYTKVHFVVYDTVTNDGQLYNTLQLVRSVRTLGWCANHRPHKYRSGSTHLPSHPEDNTRVFL